MLLLTYLTREAEEIQKILVFEGAFEKIFSIIKEEGGSDGGVVVQVILFTHLYVISLYLEMKLLINLDPLICSLPHRIVLNCWTILFAAMHPIRYCLTFSQQEFYWVEAFYILCFFRQCYRCCWEKLSALIHWYPFWNSEEAHTVFLNKRLGFKCLIVILTILSVGDLYRWLSDFLLLFNFNWCQ